MGIRRPVNILAGEHKGKSGELVRWTNWAHAKGQVKLEDGTIVVVKWYEMDPIWAALSGCGTTKRNPQA